MANVNLYKSHNWAFSLALTIFQKLPFHILYNICNGTIWCKIHDFLFDGKSYVCTVSHIYEIFANQIKCKKFDLENEGQDQGGEKLDLSHSTGKVWFYVNDIFFFIILILATWKHTFMQNVTDTHALCMHTHTDTALTWWKTYLSFCYFSVLASGFKSLPIPFPVAYHRALS